MLPGWEERTDLGTSQPCQRRTSQNQLSYSTSFLSYLFPLNPDHVLLFWASQVVRVVKNPLANAGDVRDVGSIPRLGNAKSLHYSCLENSTDRGGT